MQQNDGLAAPDRPDAICLEQSSCVRGTYPAKMRHCGEMGNLCDAVGAVPNYADAVEAADVGSVSGA